MMTIATWTWKQTLVWICLIIWIATFMLGRSLDASNEFKTPQPYVNSLGVPIHIYEDPKLGKFTFRKYLLAHCACAESNLTSYYFVFFLLKKNPVN